MSQATATAPATVMDSALLDEVVHWVKTLTSVGVSPDTAVQVTTELLLAASAQADGDDGGEDEYEEFEEE